MTPQASALANIAAMQALSLQVIQLWQGIRALQQAIAQNNPNSTWENLPTAAVTAAGSLGAADASPVQTNPITTNNIDLSYQTITNAQYNLGVVANFLDGTSVPGSASNMMGAMYTMAGITQ